MEISFKKVPTAKDLIISTLIILAGIGLYFVNHGVGIVLAALGLLMLLFYKTAYKKIGDNDIILTKKAFDIASSCRSSLIDFLEGKDVKPEIRLPDGSGIARLEVYFNRDAGVAYAQVFSFSSYNYEPATDIVELHSPEALILIDTIRNAKI